MIITKISTNLGRITASDVEDLVAFRLFKNSWATNLKNLHVQEVELRELGPLVYYQEKFRSDSEINFEVVGVNSRWARLVAGKRDWLLH